MSPYVNDPMVMKNEFISNRHGFAEILLLKRSRCRPLMIFVGYSRPYNIEEAVSKGKNLNPEVAK